MRWLKFFLSHSLFVSFCAAALCYQTFILLHIPIEYSICKIIFWCTLGSYNLYWVLSKWSFKKNPSWQFSHYSIHVILLLVSALALFFFYPLICLLWPYFIITTISTILYCLPLLHYLPQEKYIKPGCIKTVLLAFTWSFATVMLPAHSIIFLSFKDLIFVFLWRFLFLMSLCIIFDLRDRKIDLFNGVKSIATELSEQSVHVLMFFIFFIQILMLFFYSYFNVETRQAFVLLVTAVLSILCYILSLLKARSYFFYYFLVDGLMLFTSIATFLATI